MNGALAMVEFERTIYNAFRRLVPENGLGDHLIAFCRFLARHHRLPKKASLFNDELYRMKTSGEILDPIRVFVTDKEFVKLYVKATVGDQFNVPTMAVLRSPHDVRNFSFPSACCIKPTHASGLAILRKRGEEIDLNAIEAWFSLNYYRLKREANYKNLRAKVIVEPLLFDDSNIPDYKFFCFRGQPRFIQVDLDRYINHSRKFYDCNWNELDFSISYPRSSKYLNKPENLPLMIEIAAALSIPFGLVRVDLYSDGAKCLVGEITNCSENADGNFIQPSAELHASRLLFSQAPPEPA